MTTWEGGGRGKQNWRKPQKDTDRQAGEWGTKTKRMNQPIYNTQKHHLKIPNKCHIHDYVQLFISNQSWHIYPFSDRTCLPFSWFSQGIFSAM